jgi:hypothetical protein
MQTTVKRKNKASLQISHKSHDQINRMKKLNRWPYAQIDFSGEVGINPGLVIEYITRTNQYPSIPTVSLVQEHISRIREEMESNNTRLQFYIRNPQYYKLYPAMTDNLLVELLIKAISDKKYSKRPSPPFPAKLFPDLFLLGRDNRPYKSSWIGNSWRWIYMSSDKLSDPGAE